MATQLTSLSVTLDTFPDEVLQLLFRYLSPRDTVLGIGAVSRRLHNVVDEPLLWRYYCKHEFRYWDSRHRIGQAFLADVIDTDWKGKFIHKTTTSKETTRLLNSILSSQTGRINKFDQISNYGYDAKDTLLLQCRSQNADDGLARRYFASAALAHIHRSKALLQWARLANNENIPLERILSCFDLFVINDRHGDIAEVSDLIDQLATRLRSQCPEIYGLSIRQRALAVVRFLREHNLVGLDSAGAYRDMQNVYIGVALQDARHPSLPLVSSAIFCALASRFGMDARCPSLPSHVYAMVISKDLDGHEDAIQASNSATQCMYLDPFHSAEEVSIGTLQSLLRAWGISDERASSYLSPSSTSSLAIRTSRNILATVQAFQEQQPQPTVPYPSVAVYGNPLADLECSFYAALWANFLLSVHAMRTEAGALGDFLTLIVEKLERQFPQDANLVRKYVRSMSGLLAADVSQMAESKIALTLQVDLIPKQIRTRKPPGLDTVKYRVGQVFRHKRHDYEAVIIGWDTECSLGADWILHNNVDKLPRGRYQSFYHAIVEDHSIRYVAEENIEVVQVSMPESLSSLAGKYFKRWDHEQNVFVSNIRDEYPHD